MYYSLVDILALLTLLITNHDVLLKRSQRVGEEISKVYRRFLIAVFIYYVTDMVWGILAAASLTGLLYIDTEIYFVAMAFGLLTWTQYVNEYLKDKTGFKSFLQWAGRVFFVAVIVMVVANLFAPVMFWFDELGQYHTAPARYVALGVQIIILLLTVAHAAQAARSNEDTGTKNRYRTVALSGFIMLVFISIQIFFPLLPLYAIGYMLGVLLLRTFVVEGKREEYRHELETSLDREKKQLEELNEAWRLAYTDALTGAGSKLAYIEKQDELDTAIVDELIEEFSLVVCDVNDLKGVNDTLGHDAGDQYIIDAYELIISAFGDVPVYRIGGDEFVVVLEGENYANRIESMAKFDAFVDEKPESSGVIVAGALAEFIPGKDKGYRDVFERADTLMYKRKSELKSRRGTQ